MSFSCHLQDQNTAAPRLSPFAASGALCLSGIKGHPSPHIISELGGGAGLSLPSVYSFLFPGLVPLLNSLCTLGFPGLLGLTFVSF